MCIGPIGGLSARWINTFLQGKVNSVHRPGQSSTSLSRKTFVDYWSEICYMLDTVPGVHTTVSKQQRHQQ